MARPRRAWTRQAARAGTLAIATALVLGLAWLARARGLDLTAKLAVVSLAATVAGVLLAVPQARAAVLQLRRPPPVPADDQLALDRAAELLAAAVHAQWQAEAGLRGLRRPAPLQLAWIGTTRKVAAPAHTIAATAITGRVVRLRLHGHLEEVADKFLALPHRRLVVLGAPGAGKTVLAMLLTLELLARRQPREPVPVLLGLSSWDPTAEHLYAWLTRRLGEDYPDLRSPAFGTDTAKRLLLAGRILPLLDGLDELPAGLRASAIAALDRAHADQPLVVTCRAPEFEQAVAAGGALAAAAVVELERVTATEVAEFLLASSPPAVAGRWKEVADHLRAHPDGELARALSTPLLVALARTVYASPARDPAQLVALAQARGRAAVEGHLLEGFIPAAFTVLPPAPGSPAPRRRWDPQLARRWLTVLAVHLDRLGTHELAWRELWHLLPRRRAVLLVGLMPGLLGLVAGLLGLTVGFLAGPVGAIAGWVLASEGPLEPARVDIRIQGRLRELLKRLAGGLAVGLARGLLAALAVQLVGGLGLALGFMLVGDLEVGIQLGLIFGSVVGLVTGLVVLVAEPATRLQEWLRQPADDAQAATPQTVLRGDKAAGLASALAVGLVFALGFGLLAVVVAVLQPTPALYELEFGAEPAQRLKDALMFGLAVGPVVGLLATLVAGLRSSWSWFTIARTWLAVRGRLPPRLMSFLDDAHQLGVLRQAGAVYQFRHTLLQDHLAAASRTHQPDEQPP